MNVPREVSIQVDARTRVLFKSVLEGALSVGDTAQAGGMDELSRLFADGSVLAQLNPGATTADADAVAGLPVAFARPGKPSTPSSRSPPSCSPPCRCSVRPA